MLIRDEGIDREDDHYDNVERDNGCGPLRIDKVISAEGQGGLREDLYSLIFASTLRPEYVLHYKMKHKKKEALVEAAMHEHHAKNTRPLPSGVIVYEDVVHPVDEKEDVKEIERELRNAMNGYFSQLMAVWLFQISFVVIIIVDSYETANVEMFTPPSSTRIAFARFIAGMILQTMVDDELQNGMKMMKYSVNHWWKFKHHRVAFTVGWLQFTALFAVTVVNYIIVMISYSILDIAKDFTALIIIADIDDIFGE